MNLGKILRRATAGALCLLGGLACAADYVVEAEDASRTSDLSVGTDVPGYTNRGFVTPFSGTGSKVTAAFTVVADTYEIRLRYHAWGAQKNYLQIDGGALQELDFPQTYNTAGGDWQEVVVTGVNFAAGTHTVAVVKNWGYINLDSIKLKGANTSSSGGTTVQAESGTLSGAGVSVKTDDPNASGGSYIGNFTSTGDSAAMTIPGLTSGTYNVYIRYRSWGDQRNNLQINGGTVRDEFFTGTNNGWADHLIANVSLVGGNNVFIVSKNWGYMDVDSIRAAPISITPPSNPNVAEAESGTISGSGVSSKNDDSSASGGLYVGNFTNSGDSVSMSIGGVSAGNYDVFIRYRSWGAQRNNVQINGGTVRDEYFEGTGNVWKEYQISNVPLVSNTNTFLFSKNWGYMDVDYVRIAPVQTPSPPTMAAEAEQGTISGTGVAVYSDTSATNGSYVGNFTATGDSVTMSIANVAAGTYDVALRFRSWGTQQNYVQINGGQSQDQTFAGQNNVWMEAIVPRQTLVSGTNTFKITKNWGYMDVDSVRISKSGSVPPPSGDPEFPGWGNDPNMRLEKLNSTFPDLLVVGTDTYSYWIEDGVWGDRGLTRGTYTNTSGTQYETAYARSTTTGSNGEVSWRSAWKWPDTPPPCDYNDPNNVQYCHEVKAYPSAVFGQKPGWANTASVPGGHRVRKLDGTYWTEPNPDQNYTMKTPGTFLPMAANGSLPAIYSSASFHHLVTPTHRGQLTYDIWLQNTATQSHGWNNNGELTHEIMIPLTYWGDYGKCDTRNPGWRVPEEDPNNPGVIRAKRVTLDGREWCLYRAVNAVGPWSFIVFEPVTPLAADTVHTINLSTFLNYAYQQGWTTGTEHLVSIELGIEMQLGVGDTKITNYRVWKP